MIAFRALSLVVLLSAGVTAFVPPATPSAEAGVRRHAHLVKSEPANDDTIAKSPRAIRLWFSEKVELPVTRVKLADASGTAIAVAALARPDTGDAAPVTATLKAPLKAGGYVISWSAAAKDGHAATGKINFVVRAAR